MPSRKSFKKPGLRYNALLRDNINSVSKAALRRLADLAGTKYISNLCYEELRGIIKHKLDQIVQTTITFVEHKRAKTVMPDDVLHALETLGIKYYTNGEEDAMKRCNVRAAKSNKNKGKGKSRKTQSKRKTPSVSRTRSRSRTHPRTRTVSDTGSKSSQNGGKAKGMDILRDIRHAQRKLFDCYNLNRTGFSKLVRELAQDYKLNMRFSSRAIGIMQVVIENMVVDLLKYATICAIHRDSTTIKPKDLQLVRQIRGEL